MSTEENVQTGIVNKMNDLQAERTIGRVPALSRGAGLREKFMYLVALTGVDLIALIAMTAMLVGTVLAMGRHIRFFQASVGFPLGIMGGVLLVKFIQRPREILTVAPTVLRDWVPFLFIDFIYENMHDVAGHVMKTVHVLGNNRA